MNQQQTVAVALQLIYDPRSQRAFQQMGKEAAKALKEVHKEAADAFAKESDYSTREGMRVGAFERNRSRSAYRERQDYLAERAGIATRLGFGQTAGTMARIGSAAEGLQSAGFTGAAKFAQKAALPLAIAGTAVDAGAKVASYAYDQYSTNEQIGRRAFRDLVPFGSKIQGLYDAFSGREAGYERAGYESQLRGAAGANRIQQKTFEQQFSPQQAGRAGLAQAFKESSAILPSNFDRTSAQGERLFREEQRLLPLKQAEARAEREAAAAAKERAAASSELTKRSSEVVGLTAKRAKLEKELAKDENQSGVNRQNILKQFEGVNRELESTISLQREAAGQKFGATQAEIEARANVGRAQVQSLRGRADILEERAGTSAGLARQIGGMNQFDRAFALQAARMIKARGSTEGLPQEYVQSALSIAPQTIGKIMEGSGAQTKEFQALKTEFADDAVDPEEAKRKAQELRRQAAEKEFTIDAESTTRIAEAGKEFGKFTAGLWKSILDAAVKEIENTMRLGKNAG